MVNVLHFVHMFEFNKFYGNEQNHELTEPVINEGCCGMPLTSIPLRDNQIWHSRPPSSINWLTQRSCQSSSCELFSALPIGKSPKESSSWTPLLLTGFLRVFVTVNNGAPFESSASLDARKQKSSKSSANQKLKGQQNQARLVLVPKATTSKT